MIVCTKTIYIVCRYCLRSFPPLFIKNAEGGHLKINDTDLLNSNGESLQAVANDREYEKI